MHSGTGWTQCEKNSCPTFSFATHKISVSATATTAVGDGGCHNWDKKWATYQLDTKYKFIVVILC